MTRNIVRIVTAAVLLFIFNNTAFAQDDLEALLNETSVKKKDFVKYTFKGTRVINLQSVEKVAPGNLQFIIQHRFGALNGGAYQLFGLDQATIRFGLEYGVAKFLSVGAGRSSFNKTYDGYVKASLIRQSKGGKGSMSFSLVYFGSIAVNSTHWDDPAIRNYFTSRMAYVHQLIIGSKVNENFSFEIVPTLVHKNLVTESTDPNDMFAVGVGMRYKLSRRVSFNAEYIYRIPPSNKSTPGYANYYNSISAGFDIETGGHVFQFHLTNSLPMYEAAFITETSDTWKNGGIHLGFNITRDFVLVKKHKKEDNW